MLRKLISLALGLLCAFGIAAAEASHTLPILHIDTKNSQPIESKETYLDATFWIETLGVADMGEDLGSADAPLKMKIKGRGNYTWIGFDNKPYRLKLDKKQPMLGMNSNKHWALLAHADDSQGFLRNEVGFALSKLMGMAWTPDTRPCEVVLNGEYIGLYIPTETVRVDKKRVNVTDGDSEVEDWLEANPGKTAADYPYTEADYTGGWLVEIDNTDDEDQIVIDTRNPRRSQMRVKYETPSDYITDAHRQWLRNEFISLDNLIYDHADWTSKIDLESAARFFIINQLLGNYESYSGSFKLSRERGDNTKWSFGPVWDFGSAFQNPGAMSRWIWAGPYSQYWVDALWEQPIYRTKVCEEYAAVMDGGIMAQIGNKIDSFTELIADAAAADYLRWGDKGYGNEDVREKARRVKSLLNMSVAFMNHNLGYDGDDQPFGPLDYYDFDNLDIYLRGEVSGWACDDNYRFSYTGDGGIFALTLPALSGEFKLADKDWFFNKGYGSSTTDFPVGEITELTDGGANIRIASAITDVRLTLNCLENTLLIEANVRPDDPEDPYEDMNIYLRGSLNQWSVQQAHRFSYSGADGVFTLTLPSLEGEFKLGDENWSYDKGYGFKGTETSDFPVGVATPLTVKGANIHIGSIAEPVELVLDEKQNTLLLRRTSNASFCIEDASVELPVYYTIEGVRTDCPTAGIYIERRGAAVRKVIVK